ncbi:MAG: DUF692 family multinuclear iron-containing protein [Chloroflexia bacterium]
MAQPEGASSIRLAVTASPALLEVWDQEAARPDLLEVTTWMPVEEVRRFRALVPDRPLLLHGGNLLGAPLLEVQVRELGVLLQETGSPWLSAHISLWPWKVLQEARLHGRRPTALDLGPHLEAFFSRVRALREQLGVTLLLENAPGLPGFEHDPESDPETIAAVLEATGCPLLLDLSYAQTAADNWGLSPEEYLRRLPLDRAMEVHLSAPGRLENGRRIDAHEALREEDFALLDWLRQRANPQVLTLEYWKDSHALLVQMIRLKKELAWRK